MRQLGRVVLVVACAGLASLGGNTATSQTVQGARGVVFVANGIGNVDFLSFQMDRLARSARLPLTIQEVPWGATNLVADVRDWENYREKGGQLARRIRVVRQNRPGLPIYLMGYSGGCAVVLSAAEQLQADAVDRIILIGPAVSGNYDLRPALARTRLTIDAFYNVEDGFLEATGDLIGTMDQGRKAWPAGRTGFTPVIGTQKDAALYRKLRQHRWDGEGHFSYLTARFLSANILPLFLPPTKPRRDCHREVGRR
jgi:pimeloyl-ACP methyl ester carboxylesterase